MVAHPDDESIWVGGTILRHKDWQWHLLVLCRGDDADREPRFRRAASELGVTGCISDLDDSSPALAPLSEDLTEIKDRVRSLPEHSFDLIFTHGPAGEYTYHPRHAQTHQAISQMVANGELTGTLVTFAYEDGDGAYRPRPAADANVFVELNSDELARKRHILWGIYSFGPGSIEFDSAGQVEAFSVRDAAALDGVRDALGAQEVGTCEY